LFSKSLLSALKEGRHLLDEPDRDLVDTGHESGLLNVDEVGVEEYIHTVGGGLGQELELLQVNRELLCGIFLPEGLLFRFNLSGEVRNDLLEEVLVDSASDFERLDDEVFKVVDLGELLRSGLLLI